MPNGTELHVGFFAPQSKHIYTSVLASIDRPSLSRDRTLFAGFCFNLAKMFCD